MENIAAKNYSAIFYKNKKETKYEDFFNIDAADKTAAIEMQETKIRNLATSLEKEQRTLTEMYSLKYKKNYKSINRDSVFKYTTRLGEKYYYNITGELVPDYKILNNTNCVTLSTKHDSVLILSGYCYELGALVLQNYNYSISADNKTCKFNLEREFLYPFFERKVCSCSGGSARTWADTSTYTYASTLRQYNCTEFINTFYGINKTFNQNLFDMRECQFRNPAFEVIVRTAPESLMDLLLNTNNIQQSQPIYKILGISQEIYNKALDKGIELDYYNLKDYIGKKDIFHKTDEEWFSLITECKKKENDLKFFHIDYYGYGYKIREEAGSPLLAYLADKYFSMAVLNANYSFGKYIDYVTEETINQGYTSVRNFLEELIDYLSMCKTQGITPTLYSSYLKQTHDIAARNHKIFLDIHQEEIFQSRYNGYKTVKVGKEEKQHQIIAPTKSEDVKHEGDALNHCVASYIKRIIDGQTQIFFLRKDPLISLITLEVREGKICQARGQHNRRPTEEEADAIRAFAAKKKLEVTY